MRKTIPASGHIYSDPVTEEIIFDSVMVPNEKALLRITTIDEPVRVVVFRAAPRSTTRVEIVKES